MLDAIKGLAGGGKAQKRAEADDLKALIATAKQERDALNAMVTTVRVHSSKLVETGKSLEQVTAKAATAMESLDTVADRIEELDRKARALIDVEERTQGLGDNIRLVQAKLEEDYARIRATSREAREDAGVAAAAVKDVENKMGRLMQLQDLTKSTEEKITALNALAEHVTQKTKVLGGQKHIVDRAALEANRVDELVWNMDIQLNKLVEGAKQAAQAEESAARLESLAEELHERVVAATQARDAFMHDSARMELDGRALADLTRANVEKLVLKQKESEALGERLLTLQEAVRESEQRMNLLSNQERQLSLLPQRFDEFAQLFETLTGMADELSGKQAGLDTLRERLSQTDDLSTRVTAQYESFTQSRADVEVIRREIHELQGAYADVSQLRDKLGADRAMLERFVDRVTAFSVRAPELNATIDGILEKLPLVEEGTRQADRISRIAEDLDAQVVQVTDRMEVVAIVQGRLDTLHAVASEVESKLAEQLARRVELETLKAQCDGVTTQLLDTQQKMGNVATRQGELLRMESRLTILQDRLEKTGTRVTEVQRDETAIAEQEARLTGLVEASRSLAVEAAERLQQAQGLTDQLARSTAAKGELIDELAHVQVRQRDALVQLESTEDQLRRAETMFRALDQRRSQLAFSEKKLTVVEAKMADLAQTSADVDQEIRALVERGSVVAAVRAEVDSIHQVSAKSREDLQYLSTQRGEIAVLQHQVESLLATAKKTQETIAAIEARRRNVEEVLSKTTMISNLLGDVRVNLESVGEQKAVVDHIVDRLAKLEFVMVEAQNTLRMLNQERELAERIEQSIKQLRGRAGGEQGRQLA